MLNDDRYSGYPELILFRLGSCVNRAGIGTNALLYMALCLKYVIKKKGKQDTNWKTKFDKLVHATCKISENFRFRRLAN